LARLEDSPSDLGRDPLGKGREADSNDISDTSRSSSGGTECQRR
jgi:hypothetical protein